MNITRIIFKFDNDFVKVGPHNTDPTKLVLKSENGACLDLFCTALGIPKGRSWVGSVHHIMAIEKGHFTQALAGLNSDFPIQGGVQVEAKALPPKACVECGADGGKHWGWCPNHFENKLAN
jgi:hypothetical protein